MLGVIGRNGAGKSTLLKILTRITTPTSGRAEIRGRVGSLLEVGTGFHPELTGRENVFLNGSVLGMKRREIQAKFPEIVEFAGVEQFIDTPVKRYSSGMSVRLAFAVAAHLEPEILLVDEVLAVGDAEFQRRCLGRMEDLSQSGRTVLFVSHQMQAVAQLCDRAIWLEKGEIVLDGPSADVVAQYLQSGRAAGRAASGRTSRPRRVTGSCGCAPCGSSTRTGTGGGRRRSQPGRDRDRLHGSSLRRDSDLPEDQARRPAGRRRLQRDGHELAVARADATGRVRVDGLDSGQPPQRRARERRRWASARSAATKLHPHAGCIDAVSFHVQDPGEGDSARGLFTGQWKGVVRPLLEWTTEERGDAVQIVGSVLVRNEDVFVERAIRNVAAFCDRIHVVDHDVGRTERGRSSMSSAASSTTST